MRGWGLKGLPLLAVPLLLTGCGVTRDGALSPSVNDCVAALPVAQTLVGPRAHLEVLRRDALPETQRILARLGAPPLTPADATPAERASLAAAGLPTAGAPTAGAPTAAGTTALPSPGARRTARSGRSAGGGLGVRPCLIVFTGSFTSAALMSAPGHPAAAAIAGAASGGYVLVITTTRHPRVLRAVVTAKDPLD